MPYGKPVHNQKKYFSPFYSPKPSYSMNTPAQPEPKPKFGASASWKDSFAIPLPNEKESFPGHLPEKRRLPTLSGIVDYIRKHVQIEEIILIGLIVLLLDEAIEDDLLLIILIYILLF